MYVHGCIILPFSVQLNVASGSSLVKVTLAELSTIATPSPHSYT